MGRRGGSTARLWTALGKSATRQARRMGREMTRAINKSVTKPMTEAIVRNAVKQSSAVTKATQRALSGVASPVPPPQSRGSGRWEEGVGGLGPLAQRNYRIFIPAGVTARRRAPMLVLLHGCGQDAASFATVTRAVTVAREAGCVVLLPEQSSQGNAQRCWNWFRPATRGSAEAALLMAMIDHVCGRYPVRPDRVSVMGLSAGGAMAMMLGLRYPDRFIGVSSHAGAVPYSAGNTAQAGAAMRGSRVPDAAARQALRLWLAGRPLPPLLLLHGDRDSVVSVENAMTAARLWLDLLPDPSVRLVVPGARRVQRGQRLPAEVSDWLVDGEIFVRLVRIEGLGHAWSGGPAAQAFSDPRGPDALRIALRFFGDR
ncbi:MULTISPECIES: extracellular catalytic domain type 1 short-chain-length polyhydroxyalkanoate depolymerase [Cupriavidus]|uniref:Esterase, PHB depolymerase n=1 Tax=Cupriavidus pinatubonensis (strain JMP 134 / LMG 1197) TaxID=264198 RepID=Q46QX3_CUPPJ|nr:MULTISPECIES: PHB depolymerase family esterase [Cupriavidus]TPQ41604.1 poly(3-hydroxybutyrate) depolymerase [Cupriavidus pinatubonensis]